MQRRMSLEIMDAFVEIVGQRPYCASNVSLSSLTDGITQFWDDLKGLAVRTCGQHGYTAKEKDRESMKIV